MNHWGYTQNIDLYNCPDELLKDKEWIKALLLKLCRKIKMVPYGEPRVERFGKGELEGVSGFLFVMTSSITIHCDEVLNRAFIDVFSCKAFNHEEALKLLLKEFKTGEYRQNITTRG